MHRRAGAIIAACLLLFGLPSIAGAGSFKPGADGIGDDYFPLDGNGGYDVEHYDLSISYDPKTDALHGIARIDATATQNLSTFNLDLDGLHVRAVRIDGRPARWSRERGELTISPREGLQRGNDFRAVIRYDGAPAPIEDALGVGGVMPTDDGALVAGEPHVAATWYPVNDHPLDKATYTFRIRVPKGLEAIANGELASVQDVGRWTLWTWELNEPMASYLATASIGDFNIKNYEADGIKYWDAMDPSLLERPAPRTGTRYALSGVALSSFKRLTRTIDVPSTGAKLSFWVTRNTEPSWDYFFVEAHSAGVNDWTMLPDVNRHTSKDTGFSCPYWFELHPFLAHYQEENKGGSCDPRGSTGVWHAATGASRGYERWVIDLRRYAGKEIVVSLSYASDDLFEYDGVYIDDVVVTGAPGTTSFEDDADPLDGWIVAGAPVGTAPNTDDWRTGTAADAPPSVGEIAASDLERQPEILRFLSGLFGSYPWTASGSIIDDVKGLGFALENQTRVIYSPDFFEDRASPTEDVVVHELAHQWVGDSLSVAGWQDIWLNEGFATYTEWLWDEHESRATADETFDSFAGIPAHDPFWSLPIGDPGPKHLFDYPVYARGAMTLHALRTKIGDTAFFDLLHEWVDRHADGNVATSQFIALAEEVSGQSLDGFFQRWLFTSERPPGIGSISGTRGHVSMSSLSTYRMKFPALGTGYRR